MAHDAPIRIAAHSADGTFLATITTRTAHRKEQAALSLWDLRNRKLRGVVASVYWPREALQLSPDGRLVAYATQHDGIFLRDTASGEQIASFPFRWNLINPVGLAFSPDGKTFAYCSSDTGAITLWDIASQTEMAILRGHSEAVTALAFSPDGRWLASGGYSPDQTLRIWDASTRAAVRIVTNDSRTSWPLVFSPDSQIVAQIDEKLRLNSQKEIMECQAIASRRQFVPQGGVNNTAHAPNNKKGSTCLFVDGHSEFVWWDRFQRDPALGNNLPDSYASLSWRDVR